jgi:ADP-dependent NAD(P)H-hydrate dehydratase
VSRRHLLDAEALRHWPLPPLDPAGDKESRGRVVLIAGSREIPGAALLSALAALRAGAGKVLVATAESIAVPLALAVPELRVVGLPETAEGGIDPAGLAQLDKPLRAASVVLIGPGMQDEAATIACARALRRSHPSLPTLLDATAMGAAVHDPRPGASMLVTPHAGEMAHLTGLPKESLLAHPEKAACEAARWWNTIVALKGPSTVIAEPQGDVWVHEGGNPGLATAGSGDVLAGLIAGFAARGAPLAQAAAWGVAVHAMAGACLADRMGGMGFVASELPAEVPALLQGLAPGVLGRPVAALPAGPASSVDLRGAMPATPARRTAG